MKSTSLRIRYLEARVRIELTHRGFADLSLTTWVPRLGRAVFVEIAPDRRSQPGGRRRAIWSGRRDLNSRPSPWQGDALPLSHFRVAPREVFPSPLRRRFNLRLGAEEEI